MQDIPTITDEGIERLVDHMFTHRILGADFAPRSKEIPMSVTARFFIAKITRHAYSPDNVVAELSASTKGEQNKAWATATPSGTITMNINNPSAAAWFSERLGQDVALTFEDVPAL